MVPTKMQEVAENYRWKKAKHAGVMVPAYFNDAQHPAVGAPPTSRGS